MRLKPVAPPKDFVVLRRSDRDIEVYGESEARPVFSATFPAVADRALELATSELRLDPGTRAFDLADILPNPQYSLPVTILPVPSSMRQL